MIRTQYSVVSFLSNGFYRIPFSVFNNYQCMPTLKALPGSIKLKFHMEKSQGVGSSKNYQTPPPPRLLPALFPQIITGRSCLKENDDCNFFGRTLEYNY